MSAPAPTSPPTTQLCGWCETGRAAALVTATADGGRPRCPLARPPTAVTAASTAATTAASTAATTAASTAASTAAVAAPHELIRHLAVGESLAVARPQPACTEVKGKAALRGGLTLSPPPPRISLARAPRASPLGRYGVA